jgi:HTH-type transcriptional regulator, sugar sensing transcriptional regulator
LIECLTKIGLTGQEAAIYIELCRAGQLTGYEAAKLSGISRSNAYHALAGLAEKGAAWRIEGDPQVYVPVPPDEFMRNVRRNYADIFQAAERLLPGPRPAPAPFVTVSGYRAVLDKLRDLVETAELRVYVSMAGAELSLIRHELQAAAARPIKVVVITDDPSPIPGAQLYVHEKKPGQVRLIADTTQVLTGSFSEGESYCVYSQNKTLIDLIKDSLTNEMELIKQAP